MGIKKRKKSTRYRGSHTHKTGFKKKSRGSGHRGGVGMAGSGKRADQRKSLVVTSPTSNYFGKKRALAKKPVKKLKSINLDQVSKSKTDLIGYKILSRGSLKDKVKITASAASKLALEKAKKSGSEIILPQPKKKTESKEEKEKQPQV